MAEIANVAFQLEEIVSALKIPILSGGNVEDYLCAIARGFIQFVCVRVGRDMYRTLTADRILIHPGSVMFKMDPQFIVAGEIVRTTRMYAMSVSPLSKSALEKISPRLFSAFGAISERRERRRETARKTGGERIREAQIFANHAVIGGEVFKIENIKGKKYILLPWEKCIKLKENIKEINAGKDPLYKGLRGTIIFKNTYTLLHGEKLKTILTLLPVLDLTGVLEKEWPSKKHFNSWENLDELLEQMPILLSPALWRKNRKELGFLSLCNDEEGAYRIVCTRGFHTGLNESLASLEAIIDEMGEEVDGGIKQIVNQTYRRLSEMI
jgi:hypothetical protein